MSIVIVVCLALLMQMLVSFRIDGAHAGPGTSLALGYLLLTAYFVGGLFARARLPRLTGYLVTGIVAGPHALRLLSAEAVEDLKLVNGLAVVLIALTAGLELEMRLLRPLLRPIAWITLTAVVGTAFLLSGLAFLISGMLPFLEGLTLVQRLAVCSVLGVVMSAQSPAVVVALVDETRAKGPLARTVLGIVVLADLVVILLFALGSSGTKAALGTGADLALTVRMLLWEIAGSLGVGLILGGILALYFGRVVRGAGLFLVAVAFAIAEVGPRIHIDPLLVALAAGVLIRNATRAGEALRGEIEGFSLTVYILFFSVAGASLHLEVLRQVGVPVLLFVLVRAVGMYSGTVLGARLACAPPVVRRYGGFGLLPQAGLALALSMLFARTFPEFGEGAAALTLGAVALNELIAPIAFRSALVRSGEAFAGVAAPSEGDPAADAGGGTAAEASASGLVDRSIEGPFA